MLPLPRGRRILAGLTLAAIAATVGLVASSTAQTPNPVTPGNFVGYGFDQCEAPSQAAMTAWLKSSPFRAVGIYISGAMRFCQAQTNLTPAWVSTQLATGWRLLPIHLGAQASCTTRARYQSDRISANAADSYAAARTQGRNEAQIAVAAATKLGIVPKSTLFYDLESFSLATASCRTSSLAFLAAWTNRIHALGYRSGVYSSAASGIKLLDTARTTPGNTYAMPDQIWIADWNGKADPNSAYVRSDGWVGRRVHQYQGGHAETWGGVTINIDRNWLDLRSTVTTPAPTPTPTPTPPPASTMRDARCTTVSINRPAYRYVDARTRPSLVTPLQCLLKQQHLYTVAVTGNWNSRTLAGIQAWQRRVRHPVHTGFTRSDWVSILAAGNSGTVLKPGVKGADVIRVQRALNAARADGLSINGVYNAATQASVKAYQRTVGIRTTGVVASLTWGALVAGRW